MITEIRNGYNVKRFHTTHRTQEETVGHHSAGVCGILLRLDPDCSRDLLIAALMHDVPEYYTGDIPAPFKWDNPEIAQGLGEGERAYMNKHDLPIVSITVSENRLLKLADMMDLVLSSLEEVNRGNQYAKQLISNGEEYIKDMGVSEELLTKCEAMVQEVKNQWQPTTHK